MERTAAVVKPWTLGPDQSIGSFRAYATLTQGALMPGSDKTCNQFPIQFFLISRCNPRGGGGGGGGGYDGVVRAEP